MNKNDIVYAAGLFDAEGHVTINKRRRKGYTHASYELCIGLTSANQSILNWFKDNFGGFIYPDKRKKNLSQWKASSNMAKIFLQQIFPYLQIKKLQTKLALQFQDEMRSGRKHGRITPESLRCREQIRNQIFILNREHSGGVTMNKCEISYIAGLLDGDGFVSIHKELRKKSPSHALRVGVSSTDRFIAYWLRNHFGGSVCIDNNLAPAFPSFVWRTFSNGAENFLEQVFPCLRLKKLHAELAFQFQNEKRRNIHRRPLSSESLERREGFRQRMFALNRDS